MNQSRKSATRLFVHAELSGRTLALDAEQAHYLGRVLRCREGQQIVVFNGDGDERLATIRSLARRNPVVALDQVVEPLPESPLEITLLQALIKSDAMDLVVQKATELGVARIVAVRTEFSVIRLDDDRRQSRLTHWQRIARSACEQSGRHRVPDLMVRGSLDDAVAALPSGASRIALAVGAHAPLARAAIDAPGVCLAIGPEGGFSPGEIDALAHAGFAIHSFGPRTLRAETAAIAACAGLQLLAGDLAAAGS